MQGATFIIKSPSDKMLLQLRDQEAKRYKHRWCFPGGTIEDDEGTLDTVIREAKEEYGVTLERENCKHLTTYETSYGSTATVFLCSLSEKPDITMNEGADFKWSTLDEIKDIDLGFEQSQIIKDIEKTLE